MRSTYLTLTAGFVGLLMQSQTAAAQFPSFGSMGRSQQPGPYLPPAVSPYLNLTGVAPLQTRVYPEFQRQAFEASVQQNWPGLGNYGIGAQPPIGQEFPVLGQTDHLTAFGAYGTYYSHPGMQQRPYYPLNPNQMRMLPQ